MEAPNMDDPVKMAEDVQAQEQAWRSRRRWLIGLCLVQLSFTLCNYVGGVRASRARVETNQKIAALQEKAENMKAQCAALMPYGGKI